jgi:hypothetical protein
MGCAMSEKIIVKVDDGPFFKLNNEEIDEKDNNSEGLTNNIESEEQNNELISTLKENVQMLEKQNKSLEIEKTCLLQENKNLQTKIDDLVKMYPSAVALLGKTSEFDKIRKNKWFFKKNKI